MWSVGERQTDLRDVKEVMNVVGTVKPRENAYNASAPIEERLAYGDRFTSLPAVAFLRKRNQEAEACAYVPTLLCECSACYDDLTLCNYGFKSRWLFNSHSSEK
jgi:hypothetical protein